MKLARIRRGPESDFVVSRDGAGWYELRHLGFELEDTPAVIRRWSEISGSIDDGSIDAADIGTAEIENQLASPLVRPSKVLGIGLNYLDHIIETGAEKPERPIVFAKYPNAITGPYDPIVVDDRLTDQADYEVELAVIIGRQARWVAASEATEYIFGFAVANDVSARDWQRADSQFSRSKSMDTFCPIGPWITTAEEISDPQDLPLRSTVNGETRQDSNTSHMYFQIAELIEYLSRTMTLEPGDVILTGTPPGVGFAMDPPRFLVPGDRVRCEIDGLGAIENDVRGPGS